MTVAEIQKTVLGKRFLQSNPTPGEVAYSSLFDVLLNRVVPDLREIHRRFPEYTPHDDLHIRNLFTLSEKLLGEALIKKLTPTEAFCLACGLVAHDWGMAVTDAEIDKIAAGENGKVSLPNPMGGEFEQWLLNEEKYQFTQFCDSEKLSCIDFPKSDFSAFQSEYVRRTHAFRSAARIRGIFATEPKLGVTIGAICIGHAIDVEMLEDETDFPTLRSFRGENVNVQALAAYGRLIDLFDICQNRTPVLLHRFISPKSEISSVEWQKHFALHEPVVIGEALRFEGKVQSIKVWASFLNFKAYCNSQFERVRDLLIRDNQLHYQLPIKWLNWNGVVPDGFEPETVRFEFDRTNIFKMLGSSIYSDDPLVFLRELLQNAVDATRTREELLRKNGLGFGDGREIYFEVQTNEFGKQVIAVTDPGIGMDRYVILHYLSVAGRSYYQSRDFESLNLHFDPISRFGIGILSCFSVASSLTIETHCEPNCYGERREAWRIKVDSEDGFWEMTKLVHSTSRIGTTISVVLDGEKLIRFAAPKFPAYRWRLEDGTLNVEECLKALVGYSSYPIRVTRSSSDTLLISNFFEATDQEKRGVGNVQQIPENSYPLEARFDPRDRENAYELLEVRCESIESLGIEGCEGTAAFLFPKEDVEIRAKGSSTSLVAYRDDKEYSLRLGQSMSNIANCFSPRGVTECCSIDLFLRVYRDGILVPESKLPKCLDSNKGFGSGALGNPFISLNIKGRRNAQFDCIHLSRLRFGQGDWLEPVLAAHSKLIATRERDPLLKLGALQRFKLIENLHRFMRVRLDDLCKALTIDEWPVFVIDPPGTMDVILWKNANWGTVVPSIPKLIQQGIGDQILIHLRNSSIRTPVTGPLQWSGGRALIESHGRLSGNDAINEIQLQPLKALGWKSNDRLILPPVFPMSPLVQKVWSRNFIKRSCEQSESQAWIDSWLKNAKTPEDKSDEIGTLVLRVNELIKYFTDIDKEQFPKSCKQSLFFAGGKLNAQHHLGVKLKSMVEKIIQDLMGHRISPVLASRASGPFRKLLSFNFSDTRHPKYVQISDIEEQLKQLIKTLCEIIDGEDHGGAESVSLSDQDFMPGYYHVANGGVLCVNGNNDGWDLSHLREVFYTVPNFGHLFDAESDWPPADLIPPSLD